MTAYLTLIAASGSVVLTNALVAKIAAAHPELQAHTPRWLAPEEACELVISSQHTTPDILSEILLGTRAATAELPIDVNITTDQQGARKKRILIADMESTIIREELIDELAGMIGKRSDITDVTARAMRGELDFSQALKQRVAHFKDIDARLLDTLYKTRVTVMPGAQTVLKTMRANGAFCALVSGGFTIFTERIAERLGFHSHRGNTLEICDGHLTGTVTEPILGRQEKASALQDFATANGVEASDVIAVGDGANDLDMLKSAGLGVAFRAKPVVANSADAAIHHGDLTALLYLQGYSRDEFVT